MNFDGKVVVVTGGGSGIGREAAARFAARGALVVLSGRNALKLGEVAKEIDSSGKRVAIFAGDLTEPATSGTLINFALEKFGQVDVLVSNAGVFAPKPFLEMTADDYDWAVDNNLKSSFFAIQAAARAMKDRGGVVVQTGSMWALQAIGATPSSAYSAAKAGVHALMKNLAIELAPLRIRINAVAPAVVETPVFNTFLTPEQVANVLPTYNGLHPLGRNGQPGDVADAILFLASEHASWITGAVLPVDGGVTAGRQ
jgi:NAD(P)-dependent dehydrogenase (short-subunit alcohol dehydrogenase family)